MNPEQLFAHFDRVSEAPDAVPRLRRFILDLAVRGKLVEQDSNDEPVAEMFNGNGLEADKVAFEIPEKWFPVRVGTVLDLQYGKGLSAKERSEQGSVPVYGSNGIVGYCETALADDPAIIIGRKGSAGALNLCNGPSWTTDVAYYLIPPSFFHIRFLLIALQTLDLDRLGKGVKPGLSRSDACQLSIVIPPLPEQDRIVAKVDELMALCDQLEAAREERERQRDRLAAASLNQIRKPSGDEGTFREHARFHLVNLSKFTHRQDQIPAIREAILDLAVRGKLVPQDQKEEHAQTGVTIVEADAKEAIRLGIIRYHGIAEALDFSELYEIPPGWRWTRLAEITRPVPYSIKRGPFGSSIRKDMFVPEGFKVYEQQHAISGDFTRRRYYINESKFKELSSFELKPNDIIVSCSGTVGRVAIAPHDIERGIINQALLKLSLHESAILNAYFLILFPAFFMNTDTLTNLQGTAQKNIPGVGVLRELPFPLPPLPEQHRIVAKVGELMALCDRLESQLVTIQTENHRLLEALLQQALEPALEEVSI
jgi:type I restriction enzyme S subunit